MYGNQNQFQIDFYELKRKFTIKLSFRNNEFNDIYVLFSTIIFVNVLFERNLFLKTQYYGSCIFPF